MRWSLAGRSAVLCCLLTVLLGGAPLLRVSGAQAVGTLHAQQARSQDRHKDDDDEDICDRLHLGHDACKLLRATRTCPPQTRVVTVTKVLTITKIVYVPVLVGTTATPSVGPSRAVVSPMGTPSVGPSRASVSPTPTATPFWLGPSMF